MNSVLLSLLFNPPIMSRATSTSKVIVMGRDLLFSWWHHSATIWRSFMQQSLQWFPLIYLQRFFEDACIFSVCSTLYPSSLWQLAFQGTAHTHEHNLNVTVGQEFCRACISKMLLVDKIFSSICLSLPHIEMTKTKNCWALFKLTKG